MSTNYPGALDTLVNPAPTDTVAEVDHAAQHANANDAIEALEAKVGVDSSADQDSHDYKLSSIVGSDKAASKATQDSHIGNTSNPHSVTKSQVGLGNVDNTSDATKNAASVALTNKTIDADLNTIADLQLANFKANVIDTDVNLAADSDTRLATQKAVKAYVAANAGGVDFRTLIPTYEDIDGSVTPKAVFVAGDGSLLIADANDNDRDEFIGFIDFDNAHNQSAYLGGTSTTSDLTTISHQVQAGTDRCLIVLVHEGTSAGTPGTITGVTWNGQALTQIGAGSYTTLIGVSAWRLVLGTSGSPTTANIVITGASGTNLIIRVSAHNYQYIDQTTPVSASDFDTAAGATTSIASSVTPTQALSMFVYSAYMRAGNPITLPTTIAARFAYDSNLGKSGDGALVGTTARAFTSTYASSSGVGAIALALNNTTPTEVETIVGGIVDGFSGLTPNAKYYLSNTAGAISTTPGATSILVGKAISATEIVIIQA